jgi:predicted RNA-binding Zn ribbon-like protein
MADPKSSVVTDIEAADLRGGRLCLDLANTMDPRLGDHPQDNLVSYCDLVAWGQRTGVLETEQADALSDLAGRRPGEAATVLARAKDLRETIYRVFSATAAGRPPAVPDLVELRTAYVTAVERADLRQDGEAFRWEWTNAPAALDRPLWPVAYSAIDLLTSPDLARVKECPGLGDCGWLFVDTTKNRSRHWCSMDGCGSRAKMRRHYARKRAAHSGSKTGTSRSSDFAIRTTGVP